MLQFYLHCSIIIIVIIIYSSTVLYSDHRCKKKHFLFLPRCLHFFTLIILLNIFFYFKKTCIENPIRSFVKHF